MECWCSNGESVPDHQNSSQIPGTLISFVANSILNGPDCSRIPPPTSKLSLSICSVNSIPLNDQIMDANHGDAVDDHVAQSMVECDCAVDAVVDVGSKEVGIYGS